MADGLELLKAALADYASPNIRHYQHTDPDTVLEVMTEAREVRERMA